MYLIVPHEKLKTLKRALALAPVSGVSIGSRKHFRHRRPPPATDSSSCILLVFAIRSLTILGEECQVLEMVFLNALLYVVDLA